MINSLIHACFSFVASNPKPQLRIVYYMLMSVAEDEDTQKRGIVGLLYNFGLFDEDFDSQTIIRSVELRNALPIRFVAMHYCYNQPSFIDFFNYERFSFDRHTRLRCRAHQGKLNFPIPEENVSKETISP